METVGSWATEKKRISLFLDSVGRGSGLGLENVPRLIEFVAGKVVGAAAGAAHTAVWTDTGELFTFGAGQIGKLGHGGEEDELAPRLVEALVGKKAGERAACVKREWRDVVWTAKALGMYWTTVRSPPKGQMMPVHHEEPTWVRKESPCQPGMFYFENRCRGASFMKLHAKPTRSLSQTQALPLGQSSRQ